MQSAEKDEDFFSRENQKSKKNDLVPNSWAFCEEGASHLPTEWSLLCPAPCLTHQLKKTSGNVRIFQPLTKVSDVKDRIKNNKQGKRNLGEKNSV